MTDLAKSLNMSKRTLYEFFESKEKLILALIEHYFNLMLAEKDVIRADKTLSLGEKIQKLLKTVPNLALEKYRLAELKNKYPKAYELINKKLTTGWEKTFALLDEAKSKNLIKDIDNNLFIKIYIASTEGLLLENNGGNYTFKQMQSQMVDILLSGIMK